MCLSLLLGCGADPAGRVVDASVDATTGDATTGESDALEVEVEVEVEVGGEVSDATTGVPSAGQELILEGANVSSLSLYTVREQDGLVTYADVTLTYQSIGIEDPVLGYSYEDDWESPL